MLLWVEGGFYEGSDLRGEGLYGGVSVVGDQAGGVDAPAILGEIAVE